MPRVGASRGGKHRTEGWGTGEQEKLEGAGQDPPTLDPISSTFSQGAEQ